LNDGFVIIDKEQYWTSHDVVAKARSVLKTKKIGHLGTLDPLATGVLVLAVGKATKVIEYLMGCDKKYDAEVFLGASSSTYDAEGDITKQNDTPISLEKIQSALESKFTGVIQQVPPIYSAIKIKGKPAYLHARKGESVAMESREVVIHSINVESYEWPVLNLKIHCSTGTYIRSIAHDLGELLGCGGYLKNLRRTSVGSFELSNAVKIDQLSLEKILRLEDVDIGLSSLELSEKELTPLLNGQSIKSGNQFDDQQVVALFFKNKLHAIGIYKASEDRIFPKKIITA
jgi:tRNA pseudouridine55 synthase